MAAKILFILFATLIVEVIPASITYDQRQDGDLNVRADLQNLVIVALVPKIAIPTEVVLNMLSKSGKQNQLKQSKENNSDVQERTASNPLEAFVEAEQPYHVEIGRSNEKSEENSSKLFGDRDAKVVVIAGKGQRRENQHSEEIKDEPKRFDELKLIGALEQCGPMRVRNSLGICVDITEEKQQ